MCAIVDADIAGHFFGSPIIADLKPLWEWIDAGDGKLIVGGKLLEELSRNNSAARVIQTWLEAGRAYLIGSDEINAEIKTLEALELCESDDLHVVALARRSGARVLCIGSSKTNSGDEKLEKDFTNRRVLKPVGKVYKYASHRHLLRHQKGCRYLPARPRRRAARRR